MNGDMPIPVLGPYLVLVVKPSMQSGFDRSLAALKAKVEGK